jgi:hypothetical protein
MRDKNALHLTAGLVFARPQVNASVSPMRLISSP